MPSLSLYSVSHSFAPALAAHKGKNFGNARDVRNYFEKAIAKQASRIVRLQSPSKDEVVLLKEVDLAN